MSRHLVKLVVAAILPALGEDCCKFGCCRTEPPEWDADADADADADTDTDADADTDTDTDTDADADTDADVDTDADADDTGPVDEDGDGWTEADGDCDDTNPEVNPDAEEICNDCVDNDCDGSAGSCGLSGDVDLSEAGAKLVGSDAQDRAGCSIASGDVNRDGVGDLLVGAYYSNAGGAHSGAAYLVHGPVGGTLNLSDADARLVGEGAGDWAGWSVAVADVDDDGYSDLVVGAVRGDAMSTFTGAVYLVLGPVEGTLDLADADTKLVGERVNDLAGGSVATGDLKGDGTWDILIGADGDSMYPGAAYVVYTPVSGTISLSAADVLIEGEARGDCAGSAIAAGDVNGDGQEDLLVGAEMEDTGDGNAGAAYLLLSPLAGSISLSDADAKFLGDTWGDSAGSAVAAGDVDGDGLADVLVGAPYEAAGGASAGSTYLVLSPAGGTINLSSADAKFVGEAASDRAGTSVTAGDVNCDGTAEVLLGAYMQNAGGRSSGAAYLLTWPMEGTIDLSEADARFVGEAAGDYAGWSVATGNVNGDAVNDILVGAALEDAGGDEAGAAYVIFGSGM